MVTVDECARIRRAHRDGMRIRELARLFHPSATRFGRNCCRTQSLDLMSIQV